MEKGAEINLLIVEDEQVLRNGLSSLPWKEQGITMLPSAKNGFEALAQADTTRIDILLTDIRMPGPSGIEVAQKVRELYPNAQILFLSGYGEFEYAQNAIKLQACNYILKPSTPKDILAAVNGAKGRLLEQQMKVNEYEKLQQKLDHMSKVVVTSRMVEKHAEELPCEEDIVKIVSYIAERYREPITLASLAEAFHFNSVYLSRFIKKKSGHTFTELLISTRMYHAARLLKDTTLKNAEICYRVGMGDERYFGQVFQKTYGMTPNEYRKSNRHEEKDLLAILMGDRK